MWKKIWYIKEKITIFLIRNINNSKTLTNNISFFYWTRNKVCKKTKKCRNQKNNIFKMKINLQITKQKQKNKNNHQIKIITKIYHIIVKRKKMTCKISIKIIIFLCWNIWSTEFFIKNIKHDEKKWSVFMQNVLNSDEIQNFNKV